MPKRANESPASKDALSNEERLIKRKAINDAKRQRRIDLSNDQSASMNTNSDPELGHQVCSGTSVPMRSGTPAMLTNQDARLMLINPGATKIATRKSKRIAYQEKKKQMAKNTASPNCALNVLQQISSLDNIRPHTWVEPRSNAPLVTGEFSECHFPPENNVGEPMLTTAVPLFGDHIDKPRNDDHWVNTARTFAVDNGHCELPLEDPVSSDIHVTALLPSKRPSIQDAPQFVKRSRRDTQKVADKKEGPLDDIPGQPHLLRPVEPCQFCQAKRFQYEGPGFCCGRGQIRLALNDPPPELAELFWGTSKEALSFQRFIRAYNNAVAFTSLGINYDANLANSKRTGCYCFKIQGQVHHYIHPLVPTREGPAYLQLYFYDPINEVHNRTRISSGFNKQIMEKLLRILNVNPYARFFRSLHDIPDLLEAKILIRADPALNQNVYNKPTVDDVATIWLDPDDAYNMGHRNIVVHGRTSHLYNVNYHYGCYDPLQYPLFFPHGESGWHQSIEAARGHLQGEACAGQNLLDPSGFENGADFMDREAEVYAGGRHGKGKYVTVCEYYAYLFQIRPRYKSLLLRGKRLFQQFAVDMYVKLETQRLDYLRLHQKQIRAELYQGVIEAVAVGEKRAAKVGKRIILPASFIGGPRDMRRRYLDAMALVREYGKPDVFLTMTCNPDWTEIQDELEPDETYQDRPELVARIFKAKFEQLKDELFKKQVFGDVAAYVHVIEFQKRGLPHVHILLILKPAAKLAGVDAYDKVVSAEIPDPNKQSYLHSIVRKHMMHGPCGHLKPDNCCMVDKKGCKYHYPKAFQKQIEIGTSEYPLYKRQDNGRTVLVRGSRLDNRWVVPYCPYLLAKFNCHMNVEVCSTIKAVKYLYKYIYKGHDRVSFSVVADEKGPKVDEIQLFQEGRWVSACEAMWRIFGFRMYGVSPAVIPLYVHLPGNHNVSYKGDADLEDVLEDESLRKTMLTEFFEANQELKISGKHVYLYKDFPKHFRWDRSKKKWFPRVQRPIIGRMHVVSPLDGDRYYLRVLLSNIPGPVSFEDLRTHNGVVAPTFKAAAEAQGFIKPDDIVRECLDEAVLYQMPGAFRDLFASLLAHFNPSNVQELWTTFKEAMAEDFVHAGCYEASEIDTKVLICIGSYLDGMGKRLEDFGLALPQGIQDFGPGGRDVYDELNIPVLPSDLASVSMLNASQKKAYDAIMCAIDKGEKKAFFIDGPGGTGKTFLYSCLLATVRARKEIALATASSGVAAALLPGGRTAHSRFKLPFNEEQGSVCHISKQSNLALLIKMSKVIIWDEAGMANKKLIQAFDAMLRDLMEDDVPFGGKVIVFGGDFRQVLPVVVKGTKDESINASILSSRLWNALTVIHLEENMRARLDPAFCEYLMKIGDGSEVTSHDDIISLPPSIVINAHTRSEGLDRLTDFVFPGIRHQDAESMIAENCAILTPKNKTVDAINESLLERFPGQFHTYYSFDRTSDANQQSQYEDMLSGLLPSGMPAHELRLKVNSPVMLLRNINPSRGLCNGTRLICRSFEKNVIVADIAVGDRKGERVYIHRIPFCTNSSHNSPVSFERTQFPVRPSFAMTINKSQGQTLDRVGLYLSEMVFSHGQLYVALSRAKHSGSVKVLTAHAFDDHTSHGQTANIVYKEIFDSVARLPPPVLQPFF